MRLALPAALASLCGLALLLPLSAPATPVSSADADIGAALFRQHCGNCHSLEPDKTSPIGPNLHGILGRAAAAGNFRYSPALQSSSIRWDRASLDSFLAAPMEVVPGTRMVTSVRDKAKREAIIDFLAEKAD